jgi:hypothetical protein
MLVRRRRPARMPMVHRERSVIKAEVLRRMALLVACAGIPGCLINSVHAITKAPRTKPDSAHAIVVIGIGVDVVSPLAEFGLALDEYSVDKQNITGNCFHYNRIEAAHPSNASKVVYLVYRVPANTYVYNRQPNGSLAPSSMGPAFIAPPGATVYFGDYVYVGNKTVEFRRDIDAARSGSRSLLPRGTLLEPAEPTTTADIHPFLCTP